MKRIFLLCLVSTLFCITSLAQENKQDTAKITKDSVQVTNEQIFTSVDIEAEFPGGGRVVLSYPPFPNILWFSHQIIHTTP